MTLGMSLSAFTAFHVALSLIGIGSGLVVLLGLIANRLYPLLTGLFLLTTVATSVTATKHQAISVSRSGLRARTSWFALWLDDTLWKYVNGLK